MPAPKGHKKWGGKEKGTENKVTKEARQLIIDFVNKNSQDIQESYDNLEPFQKLQILDKLLKYVVPTLSNTTIDTSKDIQDRFASLFPFKLPDESGDK